MRRQGAEYLFASVVASSRAATFRLDPSVDQLPGRDRDYTTATRRDCRDREASAGPARRQVEVLAEADADFDCSVASTWTSLEEGKRRPSEGSKSVQTMFPPARSCEAERAEVAV